MQSSVAIAALLSVLGGELTRSVSRGGTPAERQLVGGGDSFGVDDAVVMITSTDTAVSCFNWTFTLNFDSRNAIVSGSFVSAPLYTTILVADSWLLSGLPGGADAVSP